MLSTSCRKFCVCAAIVILGAGASAVCRAADNQLSDKEKQEGWILLFDGKTLNGWMTNNEKPGQRPVEEESINPHKCGGYMMIHEKAWGDYKLALDFKIAPKCNSGIFIRTFPLKPREGKDVGFNGIEIAIDDTKEAGFHDTGALYDLVKPKKNAMKPVGEWNHIVVASRDNLIEIELNGEAVTRMNLNEWTEPNKRPDGSQHKFDVAYKNHPRKGYIGLQDHGGECWYKNIKLLPLEKK
ncbi:MAG: DUF1080 domain-containing protein [Planctomycetia bacterium]|nr:DUF1080 domain-containing protein [Planctomycetia bacterium]